MHGLEREWQDRVQFLHVNFRSSLGKELGRRYDIDHLPALVLLNGTGQVAKKLGMGLHLHEEADLHLSRLIEGDSKG